MTKLAEALRDLNEDLVNQLVDEKLAQGVTRVLLLLVICLLPENTI